MLYQSQHSLGAEIFTIERGKNLNFPAHLHNSFELIYVTDGRMEVSIDQKSYLLGAGDTVLIFPHQLHSLVTPESSGHFLYIFSPRLVQAYSKTVQSKVPTSSLVSPNEALLRAFLSAKETDSILKIKGLLYSLCAAFDETAVYTDRSLDRDTLLLEIFRFAESNYSGNCTLAELSRVASYNYVYLSKYFKERTGQSFTEYVNRYRVNEACYLLSNFDAPVLQISLDCGFDSLRSFNRNFKKYIGVSPSEYRANIRASCD